MFQLENVGLSLLMLPLTTMLNVIVVVFLELLLKLIFSDTQNRERDEPPQGYAFKFEIESKPDGIRIEHVKLCQQRQLAWTRNQAS